MDSNETDDKEPASEKRPNRKPGLKRRLLSFRISTLLVLTAIVAGFLGWMLPIAEDQKRELAMRASLADKGASVTTALVRSSPIRFFLSFMVPQEALENCVEVRSQKLTDEDLQIVGQLPYVKRLYLKHCPLSYNGIKHLHSLKYLERLALWGTPLVDDDLRGMNKIRPLKVLDIHNPFAGGFGSRSHTDYQIAVSSSYHAYPAIKTEVKTQKRTSKCLEHLRGLPNLRWLRFSFWLDDDGLESLATMPQLSLRSLRIQSPSETALRHLARWKEVDRIVIHGGDQRGRNLAPLKQLPHLKSLSLQLTELDEESLSHIAQCRNLQVLSLLKSNVDDAAVKQLATHQDLTHIEFVGTNTTADTVTAVAKIPSLEHIRGTMPLDDEAVIAISNSASFKQLTTGDFRVPTDCYLTRVGFQHLAKAKRINTIRFHDPIAGREIPGIDVDTSQDARIDQQWIVDLGDKNPDYNGHCRVSTKNFPLLGRDRLTSFANLAITMPISSYVQEDLHEFTHATLANKYLTLHGEKNRKPRSIIILSSSKEKPNLSFLKHLPNLQELNLSCRAVSGTPESLWPSLGHLTKLTKLELRGTAGGEAIKHLGELESLTNLECELRSGVSDSDFQSIGKLSKLSRMDLRVDQITKGKSAALAKLVSLEELILLSQENTRNRDDLSFLPSLVNLKTLFINADDSNIDYVYQMPWLERLSLSTAKISFAKAMELPKRLPKIMYIDLRSAVYYKTMTEAELKKFQAAMRELGIHVR